MSEAPTPNLLFAAPPPAGGDLLFGATLGGGTETAAHATLAIGLPPLQLGVRVGHRHSASAAVSLPGLQMRAIAQWDSRTERPLAHKVAATHQQAEPSQAPALSAQHDQAAGFAVGCTMRHEDAAPAGRQSALRHRDAGKARAAATSRHADGHALRAHRTAAHRDAARVRRQILARHADAVGLRLHRATRHGDALRLRRTVAARTQPAHLGGHWYGAGHGPARPAGRWIATEHQDAHRPPIGRYVLVPLIEPPPPTFERDPDLLFCQPFTVSADLLFGWVCGGTPGDGPVIIPIREFYLVINTFSLARADTGEPVDVQDFTASLDVDSWCWGWFASLPASLMPLVRSAALGEHVELIATLNGTPLRLVVERIARDRRFGSAMLRISGRGRAAWLADPHAPIGTRYNTEARTAQQLLADALTVNGVSIGWTLDWRIDDWLVPAGSWSHTGAYMDAATRIAEAGGGYIQAHDTDQTLIVLPRYPATPWHWSEQTPDIELPEDVCEVEGIEWQDKPAYNAVWVTGGEAGRRDRIRRTGTAADRTAPTVVDPLATAPEMTRARGLAVLGDTGRQAHISLRLPVLPETGIIRPGKLIRYTECGNTHLGLTRAVQLEQRFPDLWQTIRIETHELEPV